MRPRPQILTHLRYTEFQHSKKGELTQKTGLGQGEGPRSEQCQGPTLQGAFGSVVPSGP